MLYLPVETEEVTKSVTLILSQALETSETKKYNILLQILKIHSPRLNIIWCICFVLKWLIFSGCVYMMLIRTYVLSSICAFKGLLL